MAATMLAVVEHAAFPAVVVATANHWVVDGIAGAALVLAVCVRLRR